MGVLATEVSIEIEFFAVVPFQRGVLVLFAQHGTTAREHLDLGAHEASEGVLGRAHDRLTADVERGVDEHGAAGQRVEPLEQLMKERIRRRVHGLDASRIVDMRDGGDREIGRAHV